MSEKQAHYEPAPEELRVPRDGDRDLAFSGRRLAEETRTSRDETRGTTVAIYVTVGGNLVTAVQQWESKKGRRQVAAARAAVHDLPDQALDWLKQDAGGELGPASKGAWESACRAWPELSALEVERVE